ncbi:MAG: hypothetical protein WCE53_13425 [Candidatus Acidiferrum sp.]
MPSGIRPDKGLGEERAKRVNGDITRAGFPAWHKHLMELINSGEDHGNEKSEEGPVKAPATALAAEPVKNGHAEDTEFSNMGELANAKVREMDPMPRGCWEKPVQDGIEESERGVAAEIV